MENKKILNKETLNEIKFHEEITPITVDTYDESAILDSVLKNNKVELFACAVQSCIVGTGGKNLGKVKINGVEQDCQELLLKNNVLLNNKVNSKLLPGDLTLRRLCRLFRYNILEYIQKTHNLSYLYRKYCKEEADPSYIFPGAEHLVETKNQARILRTCYTALDDLLGTQFVKRIDRVYLARGLKL